MDEIRISANAGRVVGESVEEKSKYEQKVEFGRM